MLLKAKEKAEHDAVSHVPGCSLNLDWVSEPRPQANIHMPVNVWHRLFEEFKAANPETYKEYLVDVSRETVLKLQNEPFLLKLLDPKDSLVARKDVSSHSQMLRLVLKKIQDDLVLEPGNLQAFIQLLINITTCKTGKLNGITHSYIYLNQGRVLSEGVLGTEAFKSEIVRYFKEELRRFREATITSIVRDVTKTANPHDCYYVRGIIGSNVGLLFENERPTIDMNANCVSSSLRKLDKQQLLDLFHQDYKVDDVINKIQYMLNTGSIMINGMDEQQ